MKFCKDCIHSIEISLGVFECESPRAYTKVDIVDGTQSKGHDFCCDHREDGILASWINGTCGKSARWFEPKEEE